MKISSSTKVYALYILAFNVTTEAFQHAPLHAFPRLKIVAHAPALMSTSSNSSTSVRGTEGNAESDKTESKKKKRADVMAFLRKKGAVGKNKDFSTAMGVDEGPVGKNKSQGANMNVNMNMNAYDKNATLLEEHVRVYYFEINYASHFSDHS